MSTVAIARADAIGDAVAQALEHVDLVPLVNKKIVAVKPNETWASEEDITGVTQADTLSAVFRALKEHQPRELVVSGGAGAAETEDVFRWSGMMRAAEAEGATFFDHNRGPFKEVKLTYSRDPEVKGP